MTMRPGATPGRARKGMVAMKMIARRASRCLNCQFGIKPGQNIDWTKGVGAKHVECPSGQTQMASGTREVHWRRLDAEPGKPWVIRVADPTGNCHTLSGQEVELTRGKKAGRMVLLGERLDGSTQRDSTYAPAVESAVENLPDADAVPAGRYALEEDGDRFLLVRVWRKGTLVNVYDVRTRNKVPDMKAVLDRIVAAGAGFSAILYGKVTNECSRCGVEAGREAVRRARDRAGLHQALVRRHGPQADDAKRAEGAARPRPGPERAHVDHGRGGRMKLGRSRRTLRLAAAA